ncbi:ras-related protein Rab-28-like [Cylas formicarius]|uniref:ras-related protein Rab-28-like n=1 Tax=Cylas formicarius TaxID=197179 RepID=UPI00295844EB|nr:ras-related protein Rab-28-like [Cylas formicarius]XP_060522722.1 ras-related protein Rab-28-like [Cylas formicarius]
MSDSDDEGVCERADNRIKIVVLGEPNVGKTCIIRKYCYDEFSRHYAPTAGADFYIKRVELPGKGEITVQITDTGGAEQNTKMLEHYLFKADIVLFVYDITICSSFDSLATWLKTSVAILNAGERRVVMSVFGNKCDLEHKRGVRLDKTNSFMYENRLSNYFLSAKTGENVNACFVELLSKFFGVPMTSLEMEKQMSVVKAELVSNSAPPASKHRNKPAGTRIGQDSACLIQ